MSQNYGNLIFFNNIYWWVLYENKGNEYLNIWIPQDKSSSELFYKEFITTWKIYIMPILIKLFHKPPMNSLSCTIKKLPFNLHTNLIRNYSSLNLQYSDSTYCQTKSHYTFYITLIPSLCRLVARFAFIRNSVLWLHAKNLDLHNIQNIETTESIFAKLSHRSMAVLRSIPKRQIKVVANHNVSRIRDKKETILTNFYLKRMQSCFIHYINYFICKFALILLNFNEIDRNI